MSKSPKEARPAIPMATKLALFAEAAGHCQYPECLDPLFPDDLGGTIHLAEMAHIIPFGEKGPRYKERTEGIDPHDKENLILMHPTCHTRIDKAPDSYPRALLLEWKRTHLSNLNKKNGIVRYETRQQVYEHLQSKMAENYAVWEKYAPIDGSEVTYDPECEAALIWSRRVKSIIIPNHYHILSVISLNENLMKSEEFKILGEYKEHVRGFTERHLTETMGSVIRYPKAMEGMFNELGD